MKFTKGFEKIAVKFKMSDIVAAAQKREAKLKKTLGRLSKGKKKEMSRNLPAFDWMEKQVKHPVSEEIVEQATSRGVSPDTLVGGHHKFRHLREKVLGRKLEHLKVLAKRTRNPAQAINREIENQAKVKNEIAQKWKKDLADKAKAKKKKG